MASTLNHSKAGITVRDLIEDGPRFKYMLKGFTDGDSAPITNRVPVSVPVETLDELQLATLPWTLLVD